MVVLYFIINGNELLLHYTPFGIWIDMYVSLPANLPIRFMTPIFLVTILRLGIW